MSNNDYERLANGIVLQAVKDYRRAKKRLKKHPHNDAALCAIREVERFFLSPWFTVLTSIDPKRLIKELQSEVEE